MPHQDAFEQARTLARTNLRQGAAEVLAWRRTGVLQEGIVQQVGALLLAHHPNDHMRLAEDIFVEEALGHAAQCPSAAKHA